MLEVYETTLSGVKKIQRKIPAVDHRGIYAEIYNKREYFDAGIEVNFVEEVFSFSRINALRGLHGDKRTYKMVCCTYGELLLAVVNYDETSEHFGRWETFTLTPENALQILIPPGHINGHLILSDWGQFHYNQSEYYQGAENQWSVGWNDPRFNISWPIADPILSDRDRLAAITSAQQFKRA